MKIHDYYYNDDNRSLYVEFSTKSDGNEFYRVLELEYDDIEYYSPDIITETDLDAMDEEFIVELVTQYLSENDLPEAKIL